MDEENILSEMDLTIRVTLLMIKLKELVSMVIVKMKVFKVFGVTISFKKKVLIWLFSFKFYYNVLIIKYIN
jgi:hypothetical protein